MKNNFKNSKKQFPRNAADVDSFKNKDNCLLLTKISFIMKSAKFKSKMSKSREKIKKYISKAVIIRYREKF